MTLTELRERKDKLRAELSEIEHLINKEIKTTADGYKIHLGDTYWYKTMADKREPLVFKEGDRFWDDSIWVKHDKYSSSGYYYRNLYKERYERKAIII